MTKFSKWVWLCNKMDWHKSPHKIKVFGIQPRGICPRCGREMLLSSQGWFRLDPQSFPNLENVKRINNELYSR